MHRNKTEIPRCPISLEEVTEIPPSNLVLLSDGQLYDKTVIEDYLTGKNKNSPMTRLELTSQIAHTGKFAVYDLINVIKELQQEVHEKDLLIQHLQNKIELAQHVLSKNDPLEIKKNNKPITHHLKRKIKVNNHPLVKTLLNAPEIKSNQINELKTIKENELNK